MASGGVAVSTVTPTTELDALATELEQLRQVILLFERTGREITSALHDAGLGELASNAAVSVLSRLALDGPSRPTELLGATRLTQGGLSNLFERLEGAGLIDRRYGAVPGDRRGVVVTITDEGASRLAEVHAVAVKSAQEQSDRFDELARLLDDGRGPDALRPPITIRWLDSLARLGAELDDVFKAASADDPTPVRTLLALCSAASQGGTRPGELIEHTGLSSGGVSQLLDRLEEAELVRRRTGLPPDRRVVVVELTRAGRSELERRLGSVTTDRLRAALAVG